MCVAQFLALSVVFAQPSPTTTTPPAQPSGEQPAGSEASPPPAPPVAAPVEGEAAPSGGEAAPADLQPLPDEPPLPPLELDARPRLRRDFAGSIQLDYMMIASEDRARRIALDGATAEVSLKMTMDFGSHITASVKVCVACHGFEAGMAFFDVRLADQLNFRVGRFTPSFGEFPVRHDPANHRTSDKPLPYDMGRMVRGEEFNWGVLPAPWVDNGVEINGTHYAGDSLQMSYAAFAVGGPRAASDAVDFDYKLSRSGEAYYVDNNSRPVLGGQLVLSFIRGRGSANVGASIMRGTFDPEGRLKFGIYGAHLSMRYRDLSLRMEYLVRRTEMGLGENPSADFKYGPGSDGIYDPYFTKEGAYAEVEIPLNKRLVVVLREDGLRRRGNVIRSSPLRSESAVIRHTVGLAIGIGHSVRVKLSLERYDFSDFDDESVIHTGIAGPF